MAVQKENFNMVLKRLNLQVHRGMYPCVRLTFAFPSAALPASGSLGMISARNIKAPLALFYQSDANVND